jgi:hypothetical protein
LFWTKLNWLLPDVGENLFLPTTQKTKEFLRNKKPTDLKMKLSISISALAAIAATLPLASAFAPTVQRVSRTTSIKVTEEDVAVEETMPFAEEVAVPTSSGLSEMSTALPFMARPAALDGTLAGDVGFDPFGFAKSKADLMNYREAEVKHARLAMLAAAGWPISELFDKKIALTLGLQPVVDSADRVPSLLNGGLGKISPIYWIAVIAGAAVIDLYGINKSEKAGPNYIPGDLGFDPLGVYPKEAEGQMRMQLAEIKNGRLAMIAIFAFAVQEFVTKMGVVDQTPLFFKPLTTVLKEYTNSGYVQ